MVVMLLLVSPSVYAQDVKYIAIKSKKPAYTPLNFYLDRVVDDRASTGVGTADGVLMDVQNGVADGLMRYLADNKVPNKTMPAIELHIAGLKCTARKQGAQWKVAIEMNFVFMRVGKK